MVQPKITMFEFTVLKGRQKVPIKRLPTTSGEILKCACAHDLREKICETEVKAMQLVGHMIMAKWRMEYIQITFTQHSYNI